MYQEIKNNITLFFDRKELLKQIVLSKLIAGQKELMLGYLWWILEPLLWTLIYWLLVQKIFGRGGEGYPLFVLCGIIPFRAFVLSINQSIRAYSSNVSLMSQLNFPRFFLPISNVLVNHIKLLFGFLVIEIFAIAYNKTISINCLYFIIPFFSQVLMLFGISMITSIWGVYFKDLRNLMQFFTRSLLFLSPILYSLDRIPEKYHNIYLIFNPLAPLVLSYRNIFLLNSPPSLKYITILLIESMLIFGLGILCFTRSEKNLLKHL